MDWSPQQEHALCAVRDWFKDPNSPQVFRLFGFAGTGKTTLAVQMAEDIEGGVLFAAYTGKAASVLQSKGCIGATTIHRLIYDPRDKSRKKLLQLKLELDKLDKEAESYQSQLLALQRKIAAEKESLNQPSFHLTEVSPVMDAACVIVDEVSMVDQKIGADLLSYGTKLLVLGDPFQLPPVFGGGFFTNEEPNVMLTEIHRQARENPIIELATMVRELKSLPLGEYGSSAILPRKGLEPGEVAGADQVLVGRNKTRRQVNRRIREIHGYEGVLPQQGDKLVCLRNNHDAGLMNGALWNVDDCLVLDDEQLGMTVHDEDLSLNLQVWRHHFEGRELDMGWWDKKESEEFDYGYGLTVHKAQGSQWEDVVIFDEGACFGDARHRHLYTALTRASERVRVVQM